VAATRTCDSRVFASSYGVTVEATAGIDGRVVVDSAAAVDWLADYGVVSSGDLTPRYYSNQ